MTYAILGGFCGEMYTRADVKHEIHFKWPNMKMEVDSSDAQIRQYLTPIPGCIKSLDSDSDWFQQNILIPLW